MTVETKIVYKRTRIIQQNMFIHSPELVHQVYVKKPKEL